MIPQINVQGPALCEEDEEDNFDYIDCDGGFCDPDEEDELEYEWDDFLFDFSDGEFD